jgi:sec-independent protein translocase protein TatB
MSGIGFWELIVLFLIGLIVLGPERLPRVANQLGSWLGQARRMTRVMRRQLEEELDLEAQLNIRPKRTQKTTAEKHDSYTPAHPAEDAGSGTDVAIEGDTDDALDATAASAAAAVDTAKENP